MFKLKNQKNYYKIKNHIYIKNSLEILTLKYIVCTNEKKDSFTIKVYLKKFTYDINTLYDVKSYKVLIFIYKISLNNTSQKNYYI